MKYEIKLYREMHVSFTSKTHVEVMFVGIQRKQYSRNIYVHVTGYPVQHGVFLHFL